MDFRQVAALVRGVRAAPGRPAPDGGRLGGGQVGGGQVGGRLGRAAEVARIAEALREGGVTVTVHGPAGSGAAHLLASPRTAAGWPPGRHPARYGRGTSPTARCGCASTPTGTRSTRWRSPRAAGGWPPPATTISYDSGTPPPANAGVIGGLAVTSGAATIAVARGPVLDVIGPDSHRRPDSAPPAAP